MTNDPARDTEIIRRYRDCGESQRDIARALKTSHNLVDRCLARHEIEKRPGPLVWTDEEKWHLVIVCNSKNLLGQHITGQEFKKFFPNHSYPSIKYQRYLLRIKRLIL